MTISTIVPRRFFAVVISTVGCLTVFDLTQQCYEDFPLTGVTEARSRGIATDDSTCQGISLQRLQRGTKSNFAPSLLPPTARTDSVQSEPSQVRIEKAACGALLRDDFNGSKINDSLWHTCVEDPGMGVTIENGELCVRGTSAQISEEELHKKEPKLWRFAGVCSRTFPQTDVVLAARARLPSGISAEPGAHAVSVHLCGGRPDTLAEVLFGKLDGKVMQETIHKYAKDGADDVPYPDARGWWLGVISGEGGKNFWPVSGRPVPEQGDEREQLHDVAVEYDSQTQLAQAFLKVSGQWVQLGNAEHLYRALTLVELKTINVTPLFGAYREARFDHCRLYPNPRHNPVRLVLTGREDLPYSGPKLRVALFTRDGACKVSEGYSDRNGAISLVVSTPRWVAFPVSASFRIFSDEKEIARGVIETHGVEGLYPGDVWVLDTTQFL